MTANFAAGVWEGEGEGRGWVVLFSSQNLIFIDMLASQL